MYVSMFIDGSTISILINDKILLNNYFYVPIYGVLLSKLYLWNQSLEYNWWPTHIISNIIWFSYE